ncbi:hypothetical protein [Microvirga thermotolerans]|uniref:Uncharacterized protein n=1 Tax=Microvirga thermotolerans TaxID=2651334 RepID=A0A5P9JZY4_9HYPH|nr:hypothetical protein [Microvirga thermotolerans]QFU16835.1 hypothetical protein GDR74_11670 [Microvirga thermotolerans]
MTVPPHGLAVDDFRQYRIAEVTVEGVEVIRSWPGEEEAYLRTHALDSETVDRIQTGPANRFSELVGHFRAALDARLRADFAALIGPIFMGRRPLAAVVRLKAFDVPSAARRAFVDSDAKLKAEIDLVDKATGRPVLRYEGPWASRRPIGGLLTGVARPSTARTLAPRC